MSDARSRRSRRSCRSARTDVRALDRLVPLAVRPGRDADDLRLEALDRPGLVEVQGQAGRLALDDVGQHDGVEDVVLGQALRGRGAVETGADDGDLLAHGWLPLPNRYPIATSRTITRHVAAGRTDPDRLWVPSPSVTVSIVTQRSLCPYSGTSKVTKRSRRNRPPLAVVRDGKGKVCGMRRRHHMSAVRRRSLLADGRRYPQVGEPGRVGTAGPKFGGYRQSGLP